jgi:alkylation response protein AidB-like acyl-CoA dehydrogenase
VVSLAAFREEATSFLEANAAPRRHDEFEWGAGSDEVGLFVERTPAETAAELAGAQAWKVKEFDAGLAWPSGPAAFGGRELPAEYGRAYTEIKATFETPSEAPLAIGLGMVAPTILAHGTDEVKRRYLRAMHRGEVVGCQLFSEPSAGSDLASVAMRAERDGEEWVLNGQKVWTSEAQHSHIGEALCRTDPSVPRHKGLTAFVVEMTTPGVEVRPLRQMTGSSTFNEVFFTDVRVPDSHRLGDVNGGWSVALTTLMNERAFVGSGSTFQSLVDRVVELARTRGMTSDPRIRQALADLQVNVTVAGWNSARGMEKVRAGQPPGPEMSTSKLSLTANCRRLADVLTSVLGPALVADTGAWGTYAWRQLVLEVPGMRLAGGTDEVMRNIVAERVLGLPKEPR